MKRIRENKRERIIGTAWVQVAYANFTAGNSKDGNTNLSFTEASISEEPSAVVPHAGICAGAVR